MYSNTIRKDMQRFFMKINLDKQKLSKIFLYLKEGKFLSQNTPNKNEKILFEYLYRHYEDLKEYFSFIGLELCLDNGYAYFTSYDNKEKKFEKIYELIDYLSFFYNYTAMFGVGFKFSLSDIEEKLKDNATLDIKLKKIKSISGDTRRAKILSLISKLERQGFIALDDEYLQSYLVLNSYEYLLEFFNKIEIKE